MNIYTLRFSLSHVIHAIPSMLNPPSTHTQYIHNIKSIGHMEQANIRARWRNLWEPVSHSISTRENPHWTRQTKITKTEQASSYRNVAHSLSLSLLRSPLHLSLWLSGTPALRRYVPCSASLPLPKHVALFVGMRCTLWCLTPYRAYRIERRNRCNCIYTRLKFTNETTIDGKREPPTLHVYGIEYVTQRASLVSSRYSNAAKLRECGKAKRVNWLFDKTVCFAA